MVGVHIVLGLSSGDCIYAVSKVEINAEKRRLEQLSEDVKAKCTLEWK